MDVLIEVLDSTPEDAKTVLIMVLVFIAYRLYGLIIRLWTQQADTTSKALDAVSKSDERSDETVINLSGAIQTIAKSAEVTAQAQKEQNTILKRFGTVLVDIKGDTSATRSTQYSMERELLGIKADLGRIDKKLNRIGTMIHSSNKIIQLNNKKELA